MASLPGHPPALLASDTGSAFGVLWQELGGKTFLRHSGSKISEYFVGPAQDEKVKSSDFFLKKTQTTFLRKRRTIFDQARVFHFFSLILHVFYTTTEQKWVREKVISPLKMSVCVPPNQKFKLVLKNKIILNLFYGCVWRSWHLFCWKVPALPRVQNCSFSVQQFFRAAFQNQLEQPERQVIFMQVFWPRTVIFACMHKHKK